MREREQGDAQPRTQGGDRKSHRIDTHRATIMALLKASPDITIEELRHSLSKQGLSFGYGTIRRFFERHKITLKKDRPCHRAGSPGRLEATRGLAREPGQATTRLSGNDGSAKHSPASARRCLRRDDVRWGARHR